MIPIAKKMTALNASIERLISQPALSEWVTQVDHYLSNQGNAQLNHELLNTLKIIRENSAQLIHQMSLIQHNLQTLISDNTNHSKKQNEADQAMLKKITKKYNEIHKIAFIDELTGLPNRRLLSDRLHQIILRNKRWESFSAAIFIDLDKFKSINDAYGHDIGDALLIAISNRLRLCLRESDTVARYGGDEFVVLLDHLDGDLTHAKKEAHAIGSKILSKLCMAYPLLTQRSAPITERISYQINASMGICVFNGALTDQSQILAAADKAMYEAKRHGGHRIQLS